MPKRSKQDVEELSKSLLTLTKNGKKNKNIILAGDFNCPDINWTSNSVNPSAQDAGIQEALIDVTSSSLLTQIHQDPTRLNNILDLLFVSNPSLVKSSVSVPGISDHEMIVTDIDIIPHRSPILPRKIYKFSKANWDSLKSSCAEISEKINEEIKSSPDVDYIWNKFKHSLLTEIEKHVPSKMQTRKNHLPWMTNALKRMLRKKSRLLSKARQTNNWSKYKAHRKECRRCLLKAERDHLNLTLEEGLKNQNNKPFFKYIKSKKRDSTGIAPLKDKGQLHSDSPSKARILLNQFRSVFSQEPTTPIPPIDNTCNNDISPIIISTDGVQKLLQSINPNKSSGPDQIPNIVLKLCAIELAPAISSIYQLSLDTGNLPSDWLNANISCVFKKGDRNSAENYRPISLTSVLCKLLEHIVCRHLLTHLEENNILTSLNHGFRRGYSCETQLLITAHDLLNSVDKRRQVDMAILDFSKAFDTVPHDRLLHKLQEYGIRGLLHSWLSNFLKSRKMAVVVDGVRSDEIHVESGVPQGTVLGPLLFLCHINDLPSRVKSQVRLFADDCLLYREINSPEDNEVMQEDLKNLEKWSLDWGMRFNPKKCYILSIRNNTNYVYNLCNTPLAYVNDNPYLGVQFSNNMKWNTQISNVCRKAHNTIGFLRRNLNRCPESFKKTAYLSMVRPILEYGSVVWSPYTKQEINKLEKVQRMAARFIKNDYRTRTPGSMSQMLDELEFPPLQQRRREHRLILLFKIIEGQIPAIPPAAYLTPHKKGRLIKPKTIADHVTSNCLLDHVRNNDRTFQVRRCQTDGMKQSFFVSAVRDWNSLDNNTVHSPSVEVFKQRLCTQILPH